MRAWVLLALLTAATPAAAQPQPAWTAGISGGVSRLGPDLDQSFAAATVTRRLGDGYVRAGATLFGGDDGVGRLRSSAETRLFSLAGGYGFGAVTIELFGAIGDRSFDEVRLALPGGQTVTVGGDGDLWSVGGSASMVVPLDARWTLTPFLAVDRSALDVARTSAAPRRRPAANPLVREERGTTGSAGIGIDRALGTGRSSIGAFAAVVTTSNAAAVTRVSGDAGQRLLEGDGFADSWAEAGAQAAIGLGAAATLDLMLVHTLGLVGGETLTGSAGLRIDF
jgi:hypothetical protein